MIYSKRRKIFLEGRRKCSNRKSYSLKQYSKNMNIRSQLKGGTGAVDGIKQKSYNEQEAKRCDTISKDIKSFDAYNRMLAEAEAEAEARHYNGNLDNLNCLYKMKTRLGLEAKQRCDTISKDIKSPDDYNRILVEAETEAEAGDYNGNLDNLNCLYKMEKWLELKAQKDLDEFLTKNKGKTYMEMIEIFQATIANSEREGRRQSNVELLKLFIKNYKDNYLEELKVTDDIKKYVDMSLKDVEEEIENINNIDIPQKSNTSNTSQYEIDMFKNNMRIDALEEIRDEKSKNALNQFRSSVKHKHKKKQKQKQKPTKSVPRNMAAEEYLYNTDAYKLAFPDLSSSRRRSSSRSSRRSGSVE